MKNKILLTAAVSGLIFSIPVGVQASTLENETIGIKMEMADQDQIGISSNEWAPLDEEDYAVTYFYYQDAYIALLVTIGDEAVDSENMEWIREDLEYNEFIEKDSVSENGFTYTLFYPDFEEGSEESTLVQCIQDAFGQAEFTEPVFAEVNAIDLKAFTVDGEEVGNDIFKDKDFTMINVWATNCNPCLNELPELAEWEEELPDNVQILYLDMEPAGIASADTDMIEMIIEKAELNRDHVLLCENGLSRALDILVHATPTTFFVDSNGNIVGDIISGADVEGYKEVMNGLFESK